MKTLILILFVFVLAVDFVAAVCEMKKPQISEMLVRGFMLLAFVQIAQWYFA